MNAQPHNAFWRLSVVVVLVVALAGLGLAVMGGGDSGAAHAAPAARPAMQGVQASGIVTAGGGTCFPDAVLVDCSGNVLWQLRGPAGAGFFSPYVGQWVDASGADQTCVGGDHYMDVVSIQPAASGCGAGPTATAGATPGAVVDVAERDDVFDPATINVPVGTTVRWANQGTRGHTSTADSGLWDSGTMNPGQTYSYTFNNPGTYNYYCRFHRATGMIGTVVVTGAGPGPTATPGGAPGGNLAQGKAVQASSSQAGHPPEHAVDGDLNTYWASNPGHDPYAWARNTQWIYVDLGSEQSVQTMHMLWNVGRHPRSYAIYAWEQYCRGWCGIRASTSAGDGDDTANFPEAITARYFMLWLQNPAQMGSHYELREWELGGTGVGPVAGANVAAGKPSVALNPITGYEAGKATDANLATEFRAARYPSWIYVDLLNVTEVDSAILRWTAGMHATSYALYAWNGYAWFPIYANNAGTGGDETVRFSPVRTRYVLLYGSNGPGSPFTGMGLREFEVYQRAGVPAGGGTATPPPPPIPLVRSLRLPSGDGFRYDPSPRSGPMSKVVPEGAAPFAPLDETLGRVLGERADGLGLPNPEGAGAR